MWGSRDKAVAAALLDLRVGPANGPILSVRTSNGVTLDSSTAKPAPQHYAFGVTGELFERALTRLRTNGQAYWADPFYTSPSQTNEANGGRGLHFELDGHNLEIQTGPDGSTT